MRRCHGVPYFVKAKLYPFVALLTFGALLLFSLCTGSFLQGFLHTVLMRAHDLLGGKPLPALLEFYQGSMDDGPSTFFACLIPALFLGVFLLCLRCFVPYADCHYLYLTLGILVALTVELAFIFLTLFACLSPFIPFCGRQIPEDYRPPILAEVIWYTTLLLLLTNLILGLLNGFLQYKGRPPTSPHQRD